MKPCLTHNEKAQFPNAVKRWKGLLYRFGIQNYHVSVNPFLLLLCEICIPSKDVLLLVKTANDDTDEEVKQKEATDEHEEDVVEYPE